MNPRLFAEQKGNSPSRTMVDHLVFVRKIIGTMQQSTLEPSSVADKKNADNQLSFIQEAHRLLKDMLNTPNHQLIQKRNIGVQMSQLNIRYFSALEAPKIEGEKSKAFAALLAECFRDLENINFHPDEVYWSVIFSKIPFINLRSLPDTVEYHKRLAQRIDAHIKIYEKSTETTLAHSTSQKAGLSK